MDEKKDPEPRELLRERILAGLDAEIKAIIESEAQRLATDSQRGSLAPQQDTHFNEAFERASIKAAEAVLRAYRMLAGFRDSLAGESERGFVLDALARLAGEVARIRDWFLGHSLGDVTIKEFQEILAFLQGKVDIELVSSISRLGTNLRRLRYCYRPGRRAAGRSGLSPLLGLRATRPQRPRRTAIGDHREYQPERCRDIAAR